MTDVHNRKSTPTIIGSTTKFNQDEYRELLSKLRVEFYRQFEKKGSDNLSISNFERRQTLGTGSFGRVYLAKYNEDNTFYAMKVLEKGKILRMKQLDHTLNEKRILQASRFPFLVSMEFFFKDNTNIYFILPFVNGGEMFTHLRKMKRFDENLGKFYGAQVALAIEYLHFMDCVYRDLKPENILLDKNGYLKITDFGFCKIIKGRTWTLCGTPEYLAPEIILSKGYGKAVDWWSYGILLFEMCAGYPPFFAHDAMKIYERIVSGKYKFSSHFSQELKDLIRNLLQVDVTRRYGNLKNGAFDIKAHKWFKNVDWIQVLNRKADAPFVPKVKNPSDAAQFDSYPEEAIKPNQEVDMYAAEFSDF